MSLNYLRHIHETKGVFHGFERLAQIIWRFSAGRSRFRRMLSFLESELRDQDVKITFCITANLLKRHHSLIRKLHDLGHDVAAHGYFHVRMDYHDRDQQRKILEDSYRAFLQSGFQVSGFRCPYLNFNEDTMAALQESVYDWTSQHLVFWKNGVNPRIRRLSSLYHAAPASKCISVPSYSGRILEIPITAPDDEMLYERFRIRAPEAIAEVWSSALAEAHNCGELFHLLFHPERFQFLGDTIKNVVREAKDLRPSVWMPSLRELTAWWRARREITWDFTPASGRAWRAWVHAPEGAVMTVKTAPGQWLQPPVYKNYVPIEPMEEKAGRPGYFAGLGSKFNIGLGMGCSKELEQFLNNEGFLTERSEQPSNHGFYIDEHRSFCEADKRSLLEQIDAFPHPLLRIWRWPRAARAAFVISSDVDSITLRDFLERSANF